MKQLAASIFLVSLGCATKQRRRDRLNWSKSEAETAPQPDSVSPSLPFVVARHKVLRPLNGCEETTNSAARRITNY